MRQSRRARQRAASIEWDRLQAAKRARRVPTFALLGSLLCGAAVLLKCVGFYHMERALREMTLANVSDVQATKEMLMLVTGGLTAAGDVLGMSEVALFIGGSLVTYALHLGNFRKRWFFWSSLTLSLFFIWQPLVRVIFGIWWLCLLIGKRSAFFPSRPFWSANERASAQLRPAFLNLSLSHVRRAPIAARLPNGWSRTV